MSSITYETIIDEAWKIQLGIMKQHKLVESTKWDYYMAKAILQRHTAIKRLMLIKRLILIKAIILVGRLKGLST